jgi:DNA-binding MarR family transcriptional regulator
MPSKISANGGAPGAEELLEALGRFDATRRSFEELAVRHLSISRSDLRFLRVLAGESPLSAGELSRRAALSSGATTMAIDRLSAAGLVRRRRDRADRRHVLVELLPAARVQLDEIFGPLERVLALATARLEPTERVALGRYIETLRSNYELHSRRLLDASLATTEVPGRARPRERRLVGG